MSELMYMSYTSAFTRLLVLPISHVHSRWYASGLSARTMLATSRRVSANDLVLSCHPRSIKPPLAQHHTNAYRNRQGERPTNSISPTQTSGAPLWRYAAIYGSPDQTVQVPGLQYPSKSVGETGA